MHLESFRIGQGYDVHPLEKNRKLILGGMEIPSDKGAFGHSDGDVLCHAIADALLGATALGDLGQYFPESDPNTQGIASTQILQVINTLALQRGFGVINLDSTIILAQPKLTPFIHKIRANLAEILTTPINRISVKGKSGNNIGEIGQGKAVAAMAIVSVWNTHSHDI